MAHSSISKTPKLYSKQKYDLDESKEKFFYKKSDNILDRSVG